VRLRPVRRLTREDVANVVALIARRVAYLLERRGLAGSAEGGEASDLWSEEAPVLGTWRLRRSKDAWRSGLGPARAPVIGDEHYGAGAAQIVDTGDPHAAAAGADDETRPSSDDPMGGATARREQNHQ
jgi:hypothetical protein